MTHTKGEIGNLIFRGEDLLLGDHGQPYQTLGKGNKRDARTITWRPGMVTASQLPHRLTPQRQMTDSSALRRGAFLLSAPFEHNFCFVFFSTVLCSGFSRDWNCNSPEWRLIWWRHRLMSLRIKRWECVVFFLSFTSFPLRVAVHWGKEMRKRRRAGGARHRDGTKRGGARRGKMRVYASWKHWQTTTKKARDEIVKTDFQKNPAI